MLESRGSIRSLCFFLLFLYTGICVKYLFGIWVFLTVCITYTVSTDAKSVKSTKNTQSKLGFHEKDFRDLWDLKCEDWPQEFPKAQASDNPAFVFERLDGTYRLLGKAIFRPELGESMDLARTRLESILKDFNTYPDWILPKINQHPEKGSSFFVKLNGLENSYLSIPNHTLLTGPFEFNVVGISLKSRTTIEILLENEPLPDCEFFKSSKSNKQVWRFRMIPRPDILDWLIGELYVVQHSKNFEIRARIRMKPSKLLYQLLPVKVIESELKYRGRQMLSNLIEARRQLSWKSDKAYQDASFLETKAGNPNLVPSISPKK